MKRLVAGLAFLTSVAAFLVIVGGGLFLAVVENSGERGAGALLVLCGSVAFAAAMVLVFARQGLFAESRGRAGAVVCALLGALPVAALSAIAIRFVGFPLASAMPLVDWSVFALGVLFALGGVSLLATGYWRMREAPPARARPEAVRPVVQPAPVPAPPRPSPAKTEAPKPRPAESERPAPRLTPVVEDAEDVRVTPVPVDLPSIGQFRRR